MMTAQELFQACRVRLIASGNELRSLFLDDTAHRAELEDGERAAFVADAYLPEEHRAVALVRNEETEQTTIPAKAATRSKPRLMQRCTFPMASCPLSSIISSLSPLVILL